MKTTTNDSRSITVNRISFDASSEYGPLTVQYTSPEGELVVLQINPNENINLGDGMLPPPIPLLDDGIISPEGATPVVFSLSVQWSNEEDEERTLENSLRLNDIDSNEGLLNWSSSEEGFDILPIGNYNDKDTHVALLIIPGDGGILIIGDCDMDPAPKLNVYAVRNGVREGQFEELIYGNDSPSGETRFEAIPSETAIHIESRPLPIIGQHPQATARGFDPVEITVLAKQIDGGLAVSKFRCYWLIRRQGSSAFIDLEFWYYLDGDLRTRQRVKRITCMDLFYQYVEIVLDHDGEAFRIKDLNLIEKFT